MSEDKLELIDDGFNLGNSGLVVLIKKLKLDKNSNYYDLKYRFNYHSNKIEGSTFSLNEVLSFIKGGEKSE